MNMNITRTKQTEVKNIKFFILLMGVFIISAFFIPHQAIAIQSSTQIWWPSNDAHLVGVQPINAILENYSVNDYAMYWQVDNGNLNPLNDSYNDYPHKEASIDFTNWNWKGVGPYVLTIISKNKSGIEIESKSIQIYVDQNTPIVTTPVSSVVSPPLPLLVIPTPTNTPTTINVWWPTDNAHVSGIVPFKATLDGKDVSEYSLTWQVVGGVTHNMENVTTDYPHKESVVDVSGWNWDISESYVITFIARDTTQKIISKTQKIIFIDRSNIETLTPVKSVPIVPIQQNNSNPILGKKLYVNLNSPASKQEIELLKVNSSAAYTMQKISRNSTALWLGSWDTDTITVEKIQNEISHANATGAISTFVLYNIPFRDCGNYSTGGATSGSSYHNWVSKIAQAIGSNSAIIVLEPDALSLIDCLSNVQQANRLTLLHDAVNTLKQGKNTSVYIDAGHPNWISSNDMASRLKGANISGANGFALNVSNFYSTDSNIMYGNDLSTKVSGKHYIVDTSRNGTPQIDADWCNPSGMSLGQQPSTTVKSNLVDAFLWVKIPGESDGNCSGGPNAGVWWPEYALNLALNASW